MFQWVKKLFDLPLEKYSPEVVTLLKLHNQERVKDRLKPLTLNPMLANAAQGHANWMVFHRKMSHDEFGVPFTSRLQKVGYNFWSAGENIAMGQPTPEAVFKAWMASPGHRQNILRTSFKDVGFGFAAIDHMVYWCADFGSKPGLMMSRLEGHIFLSGPLGPSEGVS